MDPLHLSTPPGVVLLLTHRELELALLLVVPTTALLLLPKLAWLDDIHHVYLGWQSLLWRGEGRGVVGEGNRGGGRNVEEGMGEGGNRVYRASRSMAAKGTIITCSVLKMSFVFCQLEFLASTITLKPFSRTSSLNREREREREITRRRGRGLNQFSVQTHVHVVHHCLRWYACKVLDHLAHFPSIIDK